MDFYWIFVVFLMIAALSGNTGSPFQSQQVKVICSHMTKAEKGAAMMRGGLWGLGIGLIPGAMGLIFGPYIFGSALLGVMFCFLLVPLAALILWKKLFPYCNRSQQSFLASTQWAKSQGLKANDIRLFKWQD